MEGLITVVLRVVDPIPHAVSLVTVKCCNDGEYMVTLVSFSLFLSIFRIEDDTYRIKVIDLVEGDAFGLHLMPYRVRCLYSLLYLKSESGLVKSVFDRSDEVVDTVFLV